MTRTLCSVPDSFAVSPLLALVPVRGKVNHLASLEPALYARLEKVRQQDDSEGDTRSGRVEEAMLRQVLDYLSQPKPEES